MGEGDVVAETIELQVTIPADLLKKLGRSPDSAFSEAAVRIASGLRTDLMATTSTWRNKPTFDVTHTLTGDGAEVQGGTDDEVWGMLNAGTPPHNIFPRSERGTLVFQWGGFGSYTSKSVPSWIGSRVGGPSGSVVRRQYVMHPGTAPRQWLKQLAIWWLENSRRFLEISVEKWSRD